ncbi:MAG: hypothetical protein ACI855_003478 [Myxococcota bacterium]|jgi:hypothetical protein
MPPPPRPPLFDRTATTQLHFPLALTLALLSSGCTDTCTGPTCESTWETTLLVGHVPNRWSESPNPLTDATSSIRGVASQGVGWQVSAHNRRTLLGQPDAQRVVAIDPPFGDQTLADLAQGLVFSSLDVSFGTTVNQTDEWVVISAPEAMLSTGTVSVYRDLPATGVVTEEAALRLTGATPGDRTGADVEVCSDNDGDGLPELLISAPTLTDTQPLQGGAWWVPSTALTTLPNGSVPIASVGLLRTGDQAGERLSTSILCDIDANDDGLTDVILGAPNAVVGGYIEWISGFTLRRGTTLISGSTTGGDDSLWFGNQLRSLRTEDDVWLAVSVAGQNGGAGHVRLYDPAALFRTDSPLPNTTVSSLNPETRHFGRQLLTADLDGDGLDELIVGASDSTVDDDLAAGRLFIWNGQDWPSTLIGGADHLVEGTHAFERVGQWTSLADTDNNGTIELYMSLRAAEIQ